MGALVNDSLFRAHRMTSNQRASKRQRNAAYTAIASVLARMIGVATTLVTIRIALSYLGKERFGLWMTISSLQMFLAFADFGIGNGLLNAVAEASGRDDVRAMRRYISSGMLLLGSISIVILTITIGGYRYFQLGPFLQLRSALALSEIQPAVAIFAVCFAFDVCLGLIQRVQLGLQLGFLSNLWQIAGSVLGLLGLLLAIHLRQGLPALVLAFCGAPLLAKLVNGIWFFGKVRPELIPAFKLASWSAMRRLGQLACLFFVLQVAVALAYQSDNLIIAHIEGPEAVAQYSVPQKLFALISIGIMTLVGPLWPAYGEAIARGDRRWVKTTLVRSSLGAFCLASLAAVFMFLLAPQLIHRWLGNSIHVDTVLLAGLACWAVVDSVGNSIAMFLNGASVIRPQVIIAAAFAICALAAKIGFVQRWGADAMPWATLLAYLSLTALPYLFIVPRVTTRLCGTRVEDAQSEIGPYCEPTIAG